MIIRSGEKVLVQGITGKQGTFWSERMIECGTRVIGGVNPRKAGTQHLGLPVYATAQEAAEAEGAIDASVLFVPPLLAKDAAMDALRAGVRTLVVLTEFIPVQDTLEILALADERGAVVVGPNTAGLVTPGECFVGIMPGFNSNIFVPGRIGVISRSGSLGTLLCLNLVQLGYGQSAFIGIGGDPVIGTRTRDALVRLDQDDRTEAVVMVGEIGGAMEEDAAEYAATMQKPVVAFIAGRGAPEGKKMGHAGAIVMGDKGTYKAKRDALEDAGVIVLDVPSQVGEALASKGITS